MSFKKPFDIIIHLKRKGPKVFIPKGIQRKFNVSEEAKLQDGGKTVFYRGHYHKVSHIDKSDVHIEILHTIEDQFGDKLYPGYSTILIQWADLV